MPLNKGLASGSLLVPVEQHKHEKQVEAVQQQPKSIPHQDCCYDARVVSGEAVMHSAAELSLVIAAFCVGVTRIVHRLERAVVLLPVSAIQGSTVVTFLENTRHIVGLRNRKVLGASPQKILSAANRINYIKLWRICRADMDSSAME